MLQNRELLCSFFMNFAIQGKEKTQLSQMRRLKLVSNTGYFIEHYTPYAEQGATTTTIRSPHPCPSPYPSATTLEATSYHHLVAQSIFTAWHAQKKKNREA